MGQRQRLLLRLGEEVEDRPDNQIRQSTSLLSNDGGAGWLPGLYFGAVGVPLACVESYVVHQPDKRLMRRGNLG